MIRRVLYLLAGLAGVALGVFGLAVFALWILEPDEDELQDESVMVAPRRERI